MWLDASFDDDADVSLYRPEWIKPPDRLMPWQPLTLTPQDGVSFAKDVDGDDLVDVKGDFIFDEPGRLTRFDLELFGSPRLEVQLMYDPGVTTEVQTSLPSRNRRETRCYYGCDDFELPE